MDRVTSIIRVHSIDCLKLFHRALFSLVGQKVEVEVLVMAQNLRDEDVKQVKEEVERFAFSAIKAFRVINVEGKKHEDLRSKMLNIALSEVKTRFAHFLDYDDVMYPNAFYDLTSALKRSPAAIAFGSIVSTYFEYTGSAPFVLRKTKEFTGRDKYDLFCDNFCPIHSFVLDLTKIDLETNKFDESLTALEDYSFLLDIVGTYGADFSMINKSIGEYFRRTDDSISAAHEHYPDPGLKISRLQKAREIIANKKRETFVKIRMSEFSWLVGGIDSRRSEVEKRHALVSNQQISKLENFSHEFMSIIIKNIYANCSNIAALSDSSGVIDKIERFSDHITVSGWINYEHLPNEDVKVILITRSGAAYENPDRTTRLDVKEHFNLGRDDYGFEFVVPSHGTVESNDGVMVIVLDRNGDPFCRIENIYENKIS